MAKTFRAQGVGFSVFLINMNKDKRGWFSFKKEKEAEKKPWRPLEIILKNPEMGKGFMFCFESKDEAACSAYNSAIREVLENHGLSPFHQIGSGNPAGYNGWEIWKRRDGSR